MKNIYLIGIIYVFCINFASANVLKNDVYCKGYLLVDIKLKDRRVEITESRESFLQVFFDPTDRNANINWPYPNHLVILNHGDQRREVDFEVQAESGYSMQAVRSAGYLNDKFAGWILRSHTYSDNHVYPKNEHPVFKSMNLRVPHDLSSDFHDNPAFISEVRLKDDREEYGTKTLEFLTRCKQLDTSWRND